jgi:NCAIR mutase (PurE)-related protein
VNPQHLRELLRRVRAGDTTVADAVAALRQLPFQDLGFATIDHHRALRQGCPEVIFCQGKSAEQIRDIAREMVRAGHNVLLTRLEADKAASLAQDLSGLHYHEQARVGSLVLHPPEPRPYPPVAVICAGTSDIGVAEEACQTLAALGLGAKRIYDVGVAGIHRLLDRLDDLQQASCAIVIAGMEGALPSVVGGIVACPVIAVPTSVGYGTALGGFTALFAMLTSCASGISVVNIDNGFGAAMAAHRILPARPAPRADDGG